MDSDEDVFAITNFPHDHRNVACAIHERFVSIARELAVPRWQLKCCDALHELLVTHAIGDEIFDGNELEIVFGAKALQSSPAHHRAVVGQNLTDDRRPGTNQLAGRDRPPLRSDRRERARRRRERAAERYGQGK